MIFCSKVGLVLLVGFYNVFNAFTSQQIPNQNTAAFCEKKNSKCFMCFITIVFLEFKIILNLVLSLRHVHIILSSQALNKLIMSRCTVNANII